MKCKPIRTMFICTYLIFCITGCSNEAKETTTDAAGGSASAESVAETKETAANNKSKEETEEKPKIVKAQIVSQKWVDSTLDYIGVVRAKDTKNYSFRTSGQIEKIYVKDGDFVKAGSPIASLDIQSLKYTAGVGSNTTEQAKANLEKTINTYDTNIKSAEANIASIDDGIETAKAGIEAGESALKAAEDSIASMQQGLTAANKNADAAQISADTVLSQLEGTRLLHDNGIVSDKELEALEAQYAAQNAALENARSACSAQQANIDNTLADIGVKKAELDAKRSELDDLYRKRQTAVDTLENLKVSKQKDIDSINSQISSAGINEDMTQKNINDSILYADFDCYVISSPYKEGENIGANSPVVTVKGKQNIVTIGVPGKDISKISFDSKVTINKYISGTIDKIAKYPNENTRTYDVDILVEDDSIQAGDTVEIRIGIGSSMRYYVPLTAVFNSESVDYIYAVNEDNRVYKKEVDVLGVDGGNVFISLDMENSPEIIVVTDGIKSINENDLVKYQ